MIEVAEYVIEIIATPVALSVSLSWDAADVLVGREIFEDFDPSPQNVDCSGIIDVGP